MPRKKTWTGSFGRTGSPWHLDDTVFGTLIVMLETGDDEGGYLLTATSARDEAEAATTSKGEEGVVEQRLKPGEAIFFDTVTFHCVPAVLRGKRRMVLAVFF